MAIYTYRCKNCKNVSEIERNINDTSKVYCPRCAHNGSKDCEMERVYQSANVNLSFHGSYNSSRGEK